MHVCTVPYKTNSINSFQRCSRIIVVLLSLADNHICCGQDSNPIMIQQCAIISPHCVKHNFALASSILTVNSQCHEVSKVLWVYSVYIALGMVVLKANTWYYTPCIQVLTVGTHEHFKMLWVCLHVLHSTAWVW
jgi:hypothetical protein